VKDTLRREIAEEYCTTVVEQVFLGYRDVHRTVGGVSTHWVTLDFAVRIDPVQADNGEPHKFESVAWYSLDALPAPLHSQFPRFLDLYREELLRHGIVRKH
jgi:ADP-ribose pyrophosphatase YjhB (NUDIX family)